MPYVNVGDENSGNITLYYEDHGSGQPVVLIHGYPLSQRSWEKQVLALVDAGYRTIAYDRRGHGYSSKPAFGYDFDTLTDDLHKLLTELDLENVALVGYSMGSGEVVRYLGRFGADRVSRAVIISGITPFLLKTQEDPEGFDKSAFETMKRQNTENRLSFLMGYLQEMYNTDMILGARMSQEVMLDGWNVASAASPFAIRDSLDAIQSDFRQDIRRIDVPTLILHGDQDRTCPLPFTGARMAKMIEGSRFVVLPGGPHAVLWTHPEQINKELIDFLGGRQVRVRAA